MKRKLIPLILIMVYQTTLLAQSNQNAVGLPSINNSFSSKLGIEAAKSGLDVSLYTGALQMNVPICELPSNELTIPVTLNYIGGRGIRVQDYASSAGLGWQLDAGGSVSRIVRGYPDEQANGYIGSSGYGQQISNVIASNGTIPTAFAPGSGSAQPAADGEPDIFYVKTPFFAFQFSFDGSGNPVVSNTTGIQVSFINSHTAFQVTDDKGNIYYFGSTSATVENTTATLYGTSYTFPTTWYLDKITSYNAKDNITFVYQAASQNEVTYNYQKTRSNIQGSVTTNTAPVVNTVIAPKYISQIISSLGEVDFNYLWSGRLDIPNAGILNTITIKSYDPQLQTTSNILKTFSFYYGYFGGGPGTADPTNTLRLMLDHIAVAGNTSETSTPLTCKTFAYNTAVNLPSRQSDYCDYWGYYTNLQNPSVTATTDPMVAPDLRIPYFPYASANILTKVIDLDGGSTSITYALNDFYKTSNNTTVQTGGLRVSSLTRGLPTGETIPTTYTYTDNSGNSTGQVMTESYRNMGYTVSLYGLLGEQVTYSQTQSLIYDVDGVFTGYSAVKVVGQNGGYTVNQFKNFSDFPDYLNTTSLNTITSYSFAAPLVTSSISAAYKRGLLYDQASYTSSGNKLSEDIYAYTALTSPVSSTSYGYHPFYIFDYDYYGNAYNFNFGSSYWTTIENFRVSQVTHKEYEQNNSGNYMQSVTAYSYLANSTVAANNNRMVKTISSTDSKSHAFSKTFYYPDDPATPMLTSTEQTAVNAMVGANRLNVILHETDNKNGAITQAHNIMGTGTAYNNSGYANTYITASAKYNNNTQVAQENFNYNQGTSNLISSNTTNGKLTGILYDYNYSYPVAKVVNAGTVTGIQQSLAGFGGTFSGYYSSQFTVGYTGTIAFSLYPATYPGSGVSLNISYSISGPASASGSVCIGACASYASVTLPAMPPGTYSINLYVSGGSSQVYCSGSYPAMQAGLVNEYFYEGFEQSGWGSNVTNGVAHTGNAYYSNTSTSYYVPYIIPNSRSYILQYWSLVSGTWTFNEQSYSGPQNISGQIDDIRIFPADAQMTTYTYNPLVGKTSETDPSGKTTSYEFDGLGRSSVVRDNDKNIISKTCYSYSGQTVACIAVNAIPITVCCNGSNNSWGASFTNTVTNQVYFIGIPITPSYSIGSVTNIPPGTYNVSIYWQYMGTGPTTGPNGGSHLLAFGSYNQYGPQSSMTISGVSITTAQTISIPF